MTREVPSSRQRRASSIATRMAWADSGAGRMASARGERPPPRLDAAVVVQRADVRRHAVVSEPAGVDPGRDEGVPEGVHLDDRRHPGRVAVVEGVATLRQARAGGRLDGGDPRGAPGAGALCAEGEGEAREVAAAPAAAADDVPVLAGP